MWDLQIDTLATELSTIHSRSAPSQSCTLSVCRGDRPTESAVSGDGVFGVCERAVGP